MHCGFLSREVFDALNFRTVTPNLMEPKEPLQKPAAVIV